MRVDDRHADRIDRRAAGPHDWRPARFMVVVAHPTTPTTDRPRLPRSGSTPARSAGSSAVPAANSGEDPDHDPLALAAAREAEQRAAADIVGYAGVSFLNQPDGALANDLPLRELLVREIRTFRPDAVLTHDPEVVIYGDGGINHTDHRAAGIAAIDAVFPAARNPMAFPWLARSGLAPHRVRRVYLFWCREPTAWVDVSATIGRKIDALRAHVSQVHELGRLDERIRTGRPATGA